MNDRSSVADARNCGSATLIVLAALLLNCAAPASAASASAASATDACLPGERGFLKASLRGALDLKPDWHGAQLQCSGGLRPGARGMRLSFVATLPDGAQVLRIVFGIAATPGQPRTQTVATNVTIIVEGTGRVYSTLGDDKCTIETLLQEKLPRSRAYRIAARGFCTAPAVAVGGDERLYVDRFDFAGGAQWEEQDLGTAPTTI